MNGCFGEGKDRHVAYCESVKVVDRRGEEEDGTTVIHEKERFSQRLTLLYGNGRIALLSEKASDAHSRKEKRDAECAPTDGRHLSIILCFEGPIRERFVVTRVYALRQAKFPSTPPTLNRAAAVG